MLKVIVILVRVLVGPFYKLNTGFFLFFFLLLFGLMNARDIVLYHSSLMQVIVASWVGVVAAAVVVLLYNYKCVAHVLRSLEQPENSFLVSLQGLPVLHQAGALLLCQLLLFMPVLLYFGLAISIGLLQGFVSSSLVLLLLLIGCCVASASLYYSKLNGFHKPAAALPFSAHATFRTPPVLYTIFYLLHERKLVWLGLKLFSGLVLYLVFVANRESFSLPYFRLLFLLCTVAHSMLVYYSFEFVERQLAFTRNLPLSRSRHLATYLVTCLLLLLPEFCWLLACTGDLMSWPELLLTFTTGAGQLLLLTAVLYLPKMHLQRFALFACLVYLVSAVLLPSGITIVLATEVGAALYIFYSRYYKLTIDTEL